MRSVVRLTVIQEVRVTTTCVVERLDTVDEVLHEEARLERRAAESAYERKDGRLRQRKGHLANELTPEEVDLFVFRSLLDLPSTADFPPRPTKRSECRNGPRPCPYVSCRYHLYLEVGKNGLITINFPDDDVMDLEETCALDIAERKGEREKRQLARLMNYTPEAIRQLLRKSEHRYFKHARFILKAMLSEE